MPSGAHRSPLPHAWLALAGLLILAEQLALAPAVWWATLAPESEATRRLARWAEATAAHRDIFLGIFIALGLVGLWWRGTATLRLLGLPLVLGWALVTAAALLSVATIRWPLPRPIQLSHLCALTLTVALVLLTWSVAGQRLLWATVGTLWAAVGLCRHLAALTADPGAANAPGWLGAANCLGLAATLLAAGVAFTEGRSAQRRAWARWIALAAALAVAVVWHLSLARGGAAQVAVAKHLVWRGDWPALLHSLALLAGLVTVVELAPRRRLRWLLWPLGAWMALGSQASFLAQLAGLWAVLAFAVVLGWAEETGQSDRLLPSYLS